MEFVKDERLHAFQRGIVEHLGHLRGFTRTRGRLQDQPTVLLEFGRELRFAVKDRQTRGHT